MGRNRYTQVQAAGAVVFLIAVLVLDRLTGRPVFRPGALLIEVGIIVWALITATLIHEMGHLIGGWLVGFRITALTLGPLRIEQTAYGQHMTWTASRLSEVAAARVGVAPVRFERVDQRACWAVLGGPLASIVSGLVGLVGFVPLWINTQSWVAPYGAGVFGVLSLIVGVGNGLVLTHEGYRSDGWYARALREGKAPGKEHAAVLTLRGYEVLLRANPGEWPPEAMEILSESYSAAERVVGLIAQAEYHEARGGKPEWVWPSIQQAAELPEASGWRYAVTIAYGAAHYGGAADVAEAWFRAATEQNPPKAALLIPAVAILIAQGEDAREAIKRAVSYFERDESGYGQFMLARVKRLDGDRGSL